MKYFKYLVLVLLFSVNLSYGATGDPVMEGKNASTVNATQIEIGNNTDTTIARESAGDITVEGNHVYRAGGTDVAIADGGTGASDAATARTNLGLGSMATQAANNVAITGGTISGAKYTDSVVVTNTDTQTLPAAVVGLRRIYSTESNAVVMTIAPASGEKIMFGRVLGGVNKTLVGDGLAYSVAYCECITAGVFNCYDNSGVFSLTP